MNRWQRLLNRRRSERQLDDELRYHFDRLIADHIRAGMSEAEARCAARLEFGGVMQTKEACREVSGWAWIDALAQDLRYGLRMLLKNPGFSFVGVTALAFGIGTNVLIFTLANGLLLRPLAVANPESVIRAYTNLHSNTSYADYLDYRDSNHTLSALAAFQMASISMRADGPPEHAWGMTVSGNYFDALGIVVARGRGIALADDQIGAPGAVVISDGFWRRRFGSDPSLIGHQLVLNGNPFTIIGVAPGGFTGTMAPLIPELWVAWNAPGFAPSRDDIIRRRGRSTHLIGRLRPGVSRLQAQADLSARAAALALEHPETNRDLTITVYPGRTLSDDFGSAPTLFVGLLMAVVGLVLLIACTNLANLLLARSAARRREIATRLALGAGRRRLVRQLLTESLLLSGCGGLAAFVLAAVAARAIATIRITAMFPVGLQLDFDWRVVTFGVGLSLCTTILFGLTPALAATRRDVVPGLKDGLGASGSQKSRLRASLMIAQVAMSTLLLVSAGLLIRSLVGAHAIDRGFSSDHVLVANFDLDTRGYAPERGATFYEQLIERLEQMPGVIAANVVDIVPLTLSNQTRTILKEGQLPPERADTLEPTYINTVSRGHFRTLTIPLLSGRDFDATDRATSPQVAIVNQTLANKLWPRENPLGKRVREWDRRSAFGPWLEVVGLVRDSKYVTVGEDPKPFMYRPLAQAYRAEPTLLVRVSGDPLAAFPSVRDQVQSLDRDLPVFGAATLDDATSISLLPMRIAATLAATLGFVALALAALGLYGVMSYLVRQRAREIGIRMALGAQRQSVISLLTRQGMHWTFIGIAVGLGVCTLCTRLLSGLLYGVGARDPVAFVGVPLLLAVIAYMACSLPGYRASRMDPLIALREE